MPKKSLVNYLSLPASMGFLFSLVTFSLLAISAVIAPPGPGRESTLPVLMLSFALGAALGLFVLLKDYLSSKVLLLADCFFVGASIYIVGLFAGQFYCGSFDFRCTRSFNYIIPLVALIGAAFTYKKSRQ